MSGCTPRLCRFASLNTRSRALCNQSCKIAQTSLGKQAAPPPLPHPVGSTYLQSNWVWKSVGTKAASTHGLEDTGTDSGFSIRDSASATQQWVEIRSPASSPSQDWHVGPGDLIQHGVSLTKCPHHCKDTLTTPVGHPPNPVLVFLGGSVCLCWILKPPLSSGHSMMTGRDMLCFLCKVGSHRIQRRRWSQLWVHPRKCFLRVCSDALRPWRGQKDPHCLCFKLHNILGFFLSNHPVFINSQS